MLKITDDLVTKKLEEALRFALEVGALRDLLNGLLYLAGYGAKTQTRCTLWADSAKYSFAFQMARRENENEEFKPRFNGGLIYHGPAADEVDQHSVQLDPRPNVHTWSVHT